VANEPVAVFVALRLLSSVIMQASTSKCLALPTNVPTDETPAVSVACDDGRGVSEWAPGSDCSDGAGQNSSADNLEETPRSAFGVTLCSRNG